MEDCLECQKNKKKYTKKEIIKEIKAFLKNPNNFYVIFDSKNGFYKFEEVK